MSKFVFLEPVRDTLGAEICKATGLDANTVRRIVIDLQVGEIEELGITVKETEA